MSETHPAKDATSNAGQQPHSPKQGSVGLDTASTAVSNPFALIKRATTAVPAFKYAIPSVGLVGILSLARAANLPPVAYVLGVPGVLIITLVFFYFERVTKLQHRTLSLQATVFSWAVLAFFLLSAGAFLSSVLFAFPMDLRTPIMQYLHQSLTGDGTSDHRRHWKQVAQSVRRVVAGPRGQVYFVTSSLDHILRLEPTGKLTPLPAIPPRGSQKEGVSAVSLDGQGELLAVSTSLQSYRFLGGTWRSMEAACRLLAGGGQGRIFGVHFESLGVFEYFGPQRFADLPPLPEYEHVKEEPVSLLVDLKGLPVVLSKQGAIWRFDGQQWHPKDPRLRLVAGNASGFMIGIPLDSNCSIVSVADGGGESFPDLCTKGDKDVALVDLAVTADGRPIVVTTSGLAYEFVRG